MRSSALPEIRCGTGGTTVRVSAREVREVGFRALRAAGVSAGEAAAVAQLALAAEIHGWAGLAALRTEIASSSWHMSPAQVTTQDGLSIVAGYMCGGALRIGVHAFDLVSARAENEPRVDVFVRGIGFQYALLCPAMELVEGVGGTTMLAELDGAGATTFGAVCGSDGNVSVRTTDFAEFDSFIPKAARSTATGPHGGVCITHTQCDEIPGIAWPVASTRGQRERDRTDAISCGSHVQQGDWEAVHRASQRFLVSDSTE